MLAEEGKTPSGGSGTWVCWVWYACRGLSDQSTNIPPPNPHTAHTADPIVAMFTAKLASNPSLPVPIAGVQTLLEVMSRSRAVTIMGIQTDLKGACVG
jgi:hypothetical protein